MGSGSVWLSEAVSKDRKKGAQRSYVEHNVLKVNNSFFVKNLVLFVIKSVLTTSCIQNFQTDCYPLTPDHTFLNISSSEKTKADFLLHFFIVSLF